MKDRDIHKFIEEQDSKRKVALYKKSIGAIIEAEANEKPKRKKINYRFLIYGASSIALILCICFIIILPIMFSDNAEDPITRYSSADDYVNELSDYTIKEYAQKNGKELLYIDWYDIAEDRQTTIYKDKNDLAKVVFIEEDLVNLDAEILAILYVTDIYTEVDFLQSKFGGLFNNIEYNGVVINYHNNLSHESFSCFRYNGYCYYIWLQNLSSNGYDKQLIVDIVKEMLS